MSGSFGTLISAEKIINNIIYRQRCKWHVKTDAIQQELASLCVTRNGNIENVATRCLNEVARSFRSSSRRQMSLEYISVHCHNIARRLYDETLLRNDALLRPDVSNTPPLYPPASPYLYTFLSHTQCCNFILELVIGIFVWKCRHCADWLIENNVVISIDIKVLLFIIKTL